MTHQPPPPPTGGELLQELLTILQPKAKSLIVTVYGDGIHPHGGEAWLGDLIRLMEVFGIGDRLVRTSVFRLTQDGILSARQAGRRSIYSLTDAGRAEFHAAQRRIYAPHSSSGAAERVNWLIALLPAGIVPAKRDQLKRELGWIGFGMLGAQVLIGVASDKARVRRTLGNHGLENRVALFEASAESAPEVLRNICDEAWPLDDTNDEYSDFLRIFSPVAEALDRSDREFGDREAFAFRSLTIHAYRRTLLKDPGLPAPFMHDKWHGPTARALTARLYALLRDSAQRHLSAVLEGIDGPLPAVDAAFRNRFAGAQA